MGCSSSSERDYDYNYSQFTHERELYEKRQKIKEIIGNETLDTILNKYDSTPEGVKGVFNEIKKLKKEIQIDDNNLEIAIREFYVERILLNENKIKKYNIKEEIFSRLSQYKDTFIQKYGVQVFDNLFEVFFSRCKEIEEGIFNDTDPNQQLPDKLPESCYNNYKFQKEFLVECLIFYIDSNQICNRKHCLKISEIVACDKNLQTLVMIFKQDIAWEKKIDEFDEVFEAVKCHKNLKNLFIFCESESNKIQLTNQIQEYLIKAVETNQLNSLVIGNFITSSDFLKKLSSKIKLNQSLIAFGYKINSQDKTFAKENLSLMENCLKDIFACKTLRTVLISGFNVSQELMNKYNKLKSDSGVNIFEILNNFSLDI